MGMLRVLLSTPARLAFGGVPRSFAVLRIAPIASAAVTSDAIVAPKGAAELRALSVDEVVDFVVKVLRVAGAG